MVSAHGPTGVNMARSPRNRLGRGSPRGVTTTGAGCCGLWMLAVVAVTALAQWVG